MRTVTDFASRMTLCAAERRMATSLRCAATLRVFGTRWRRGSLNLKGMGSPCRTAKAGATAIHAPKPLRTIGQADYRGSITAAVAAAATERGVPIVEAVIRHLKERGILVPAPALVERFALAGRARVRQHSHRELVRDIHARTIGRLETLLTERIEPAGSTLFGWIGEVPEALTHKNFIGVVERLKRLRAIGIADERRKRVHANRYAMIAREAKAASARELLRVSVERRTAVLVAFAIERQAALTDLAIAMLDRTIGTVHRRAEATRKARQLERADVMGLFARNHLALCRALDAAHREGRSLSDAVEATLGWKGVTADAAGRVHHARSAIRAPKPNGISRCQNPEALNLLPSLSLSKLLIS